LVLIPYWLFSYVASLILFEYFFCHQLLRLAYGFPPTKEDLDAITHPIRLPQTARALQQTLAMMGFKEGATMIEMNRYVPNVLLIWGKRDYIVPLTNGQTLYKLLKADEEHNWHHYNKYHKPVQFYIIENAGHCPMETHPNEFNACIISFIKLQPSTLARAGSQNELPL
jgi:pimeloyl-ACP methyl ester carboxylesterase